MTATQLDVCRVTVVTPQRWADVALPSREPLVALLPALIDQVGEAELQQQPVAVQRLGEPALNLDRSLEDCGVLDGDTLYLVPDEQRLPEADFDDSAAAVGHGVLATQTAWRATHTRSVLHALAGVALLLSALLLVTRPPDAIGAYGGLLLCVLLLVGASAASRSWSDRTLALVLAAGAIVHAGLAGGTVLRSASGTGWDSPACWVAVAALVFGAATVAHAGTGGLSVGFAGVALGGLVAVVAGTAGTLVGWDAAGTAAVALVLAVSAVDAVVGMSLRLAGVVLPPLPKTEAEFEEELQVLPAARVLADAARVDAYLGGLLWGLAVVAGCGAAMLTGHGRWELTLMILASLSALLRLRVFRTRLQRSALITAGVSGPAAFVAASVVGAGPAGTLWWLAILTLGAGAAAAAAVSLPGRRVAARLGRIGDIVEGLLAVAMLPVLLAVLGTYSIARGLW